MALFGIWNQTLFQGSLNHTRYFEGWYFKHTAPGGDGLSLIPGVSLGRERRFCFLQCIHGPTGRTYWTEWPLSEFKTSRRPFGVAVGENSFSLDGISVDVDAPGFRLKGSIRYSGLVRYPSRLFAPGVMGPFSLAPFMECYHGVVSMDHELQGSLELNGKTLSFTGGRGYAEKDWGRSFPAWWVWAQSNTFPVKVPTSFTFSLARIPWLGSSFNGFLAVLLHDGVLRTWASWTGAKLISFNRDDRSADIVIADRGTVLAIRAEKKKSGMLRAPVMGEMERIIHESLDASLAVELKDKRGDTLFSGTGSSAGFELVGDPAVFPRSL